MTRFRASQLPYNSRTSWACRVHCRHLLPSHAGRRSRALNLFRVPRAFPVLALGQITVSQQEDLKSALLCGLVRRYKSANTKPESGPRENLRFRKSRGKLPLTVMGASDPPHHLISQPITLTSRSVDLIDRGLFHADNTHVRLGGSAP